MRAVVAFCVCLALAALVLSISAQPPPHRETVISLYNDSACTEHLDTGRFPEANNTRCESVETPYFNLSERYVCRERNNETHFTYEVWNTSTTCRGDALISMTSTAASHTCAPITVIVEGEKDALYARIACNITAPNRTSTSPQQMVQTVKAAVASHRHTTTRAAPARSQKSILARLFNW